MMTRTIVLVTALGLVLSLAAAAQEPDPEQAGIEAEAELENDDAPERIRTPGLIFATDSILLDVSPFNGGVGLALRSEERALRTTLGWFTSNALYTTSLKTGLWYVDYMWTGRVSPYWAVFGRLDHLSQTEEVDEDNWTREVTLSLGSGVSLGVEFFLLDFLSLFAEYSLSAGLSGEREVTSVAGDVTREEFEWRFSAGTSLAHGGAIGVTVYFRPQVTLGEMGDGE